MKTETSRFWAALALVLITATAQAQRQMEHLGRGLVAVRSGTTTAYIGWRLLANDPEGVGFNLYRSQNGGAAVKLNAQPLTNSTDFVDSTAALTSSNAWFVRAVTNGVELPACPPFGIPANAAVPLDFQNKVGPYLALPLQPVAGGGFYVHHVWPADFDGDGEYDYALTRLPDGTGTYPYSLVEAYLRDGTFLWRMDMGFNSTNLDGISPGASTVSVGHSDNVTAYDLDGDGFGEVIVKTANGVTVTNAAGQQVAAMTAANNTIEYLSILDGRTGVERARATIPNPYPSAGPLSAHFGIMYGDGVHPSVVCEAINRNGDGSFNLIIVAWDFRDGHLTQRWTWTPPNDGKNYSRAHQIRIADVDNDGKDEFCEIGFVLHDDGDHATPLYSTVLQHGDRYHIADLDPDRPGLETFAIQQDNPTLLATALIDAATGESLKEWYSAGVVDVARGNAADVDAATRGVEVFSTQPDLWSCTGTFVNSSPPYPNFSIWWDADLLREQLDDGKIDKYGAGRALSPYYMKSPAKSGLPTWRNAQPLYGDLFGDWREEVLFEATDHSSLIIFTPVSPATNRLVCLAQDPEYRECLTVKGYMQTTWPSYYLGVGMAAQPIPPVSDARLVWRGGGANTWDAGTTADWFTNNLWISNTTPTFFDSGNTVLFDRTGSNSSPVVLDGALAPGTVTVYSATDYTFSGGAFTGGMKLTKAGAGKLNLNNTNDFTGRTLITEGAFIVNGTLAASSVTVRGGTWLNGRIGGTGSAGAGVTIEFGGGVSPGDGLNSPGTFTITNGLTLQGGTRSDFDLSDDPSGASKPSDRLNILGNLTVQATNRITINPLNTNLPTGAVYPLITYSGAFAGSLANFELTGLSGVPLALTNPPGQIALVVRAYRLPSTITWTGGQTGNVWNLLGASNWLNGAVKDEFAPLDSVRFDNLGSSNLTVILSGDLAASSVVVDSTANYTLAGSGAIVGAASLTKSNSGALTIAALNNSFTGKTLVAGGMLVVPELDAVGFPSPLGNPPGGSTNLVLSGSATLRVTGESFTDRGLTLNAGTNGIEVFNAADQVTIAGVIAGGGALQKLGGGALALNAANTYSGGTIIKAGSVSLGGGGANQYGLGTGLVTLDGGTLTMFSDTSSYDTCYWNLLVPAGSTGTLYTDDRCNLYGSLTGGGTLSYNVYYVRTELDGNWSAFTGQINVGSDSGGGDFRIGNSYGYSNATVNLGNYVSAYHLSGSGVSLGALSGSTLAKMSGAAWTVGAKNTDSTYAGSIYGNSLTKIGAGTLTLTGNTNTYSGGTTINSGMLQIGNGGTAGSIGSGSIADNAVLAFNRSDFITDTNFGIISGGGVVAKRGSGRLALTRAHTFTGTTSIEAGTLALANAGSIANSSSINLAAGALFDVSGTTDGSMTLGSGKTVAGFGSVKGAFTVGGGATLAPGGSAGTLTFSNSLTLAAGSTNVFEISKAPLTNDVARVLGALTCGGTLLVSNLGTTALAAGDSFKLFNAASYGGSFGAFVLPTLPNSLTWDTSAVNTNGTLTVVAASPPAINSFARQAGGSFRLSFSGAANQPYEVRASTNLALTPITSWPLLSSGTFGGSAVIFDDTQATNFARRFYLIRIP